MENCCDCDTCCCDFRLIHLYLFIVRILKESPFSVCDTALLKSAKSGNTDAQVELANDYWEEEEYDLAVHWFKLAAKKGSLEALYSLGCLSEYGPKLVRNAGDPVEWHSKALELAQEMGNEFYRRTSLERLGRCFELGLGCEKSLAKALGFYKRGAEDNAMFCGEGAGNLLFNEGKYEEALSYFLKEKSLTARGYFQIGEMYENGWGTDIDLYQAALCYKNARFYEPDTVVGKKANVKLCSAKFRGVILKPSEDPDYRKSFEEVCHYSEEFIDEMAKKWPLTVEAFLRYLSTHFADDFGRFFQVDYGFGPQKVKFVDDCSIRPGNGEEPPSDLGFPNHAVFFTIALFYTALLPQAIGVVCGEKAMFHAYKASCVPVIFSGVSGMASPIRVLDDAGLLHIPFSIECQQLFEIVCPVMRQLLNTFLKERCQTMYPTSLKILQQDAAPHADEIWQVCERHLIDLKYYLADCPKGYPVKLYDETMQGNM